MDPIIEAISSAVFDMPRIYSIIGRLKKDRMELKNTSSPELPAKTTGLDFTEAMSALADGHKVRLPEWTGYWFQQGKDIKVFTRTGDVLDTPHWKFYAMREDWSIVTEGMGFDFCILALQSGKAVRTSLWSDGIYIVMNKPGGPMTTSWILCVHPGIGNFPWEADTICVFDKNWSIYQFPEKTVDSGLSSASGAELNPGSIIDQKP